MSESLHDLIQSAEPDNARELALFADRLFERMPPNQADSLSPRERLALARSAFEFFAVRDQPIKVRVVTDGLGEVVTVVETLMPDCPFIVDSLREYFREAETPLRLLLHPILSVSRGRDGRIESFEQARSSERKESLVHAELEYRLSEAAARRAEEEIAERLHDVMRATSDFDAMCKRALAICEELVAIRDLVEVRDLLRWLVGGGLVFLGYRRYVVEISDGQPRLAVDFDHSLGILRNEARSRFHSPQPVDEMEPAHRKLLFEGPILIIGKTRALSNVHWRRSMDDIAIRRLDNNGRLASLDRFIGLFTSKAYAEEAQHIPMLRAKLRAVLEAERAEAGSHDFKEIVATFNSFPKEELFRASVDELRGQIRMIRDPLSEEQARVMLLPDSNLSSVIALVVLPRQRFNDSVRVQVQNEIAHELGGSMAYYYLALGEGYTARLHFCFHAELPAAAAAQRLERAVVELARSWEDRLQAALVDRFGEAHGHMLALWWRAAFSADYKASQDPAQAVADIERVETMLAGGPPAVEIRHGLADSASEIRMYELGRAAKLSEVMPLLQNFRLDVLSEDAHELKPESEGEIRLAFVQAFRVRGRRFPDLSRAPGIALLAEAIAAARSGLAADDELNSLTIDAGLSWREVAVMRTYLAAAFQMKLVPARAALSRAMLGNPELARCMLDLFKARLDPQRDAPAAELETMKAACVERMASIETIAEDRAARAVLAMIGATVRTNYYLPMRAADPYISLKFESRLIAGLPDTPPLYEIHVNSPLVEGCHLRAGKVARGGIRYSDRPDDYRTEILDLMKTQTVKNAIIVPIGSKGGFVLRPRPGVQTSSDNVVEAYRTLIGAMLEITDNLVDGKQVHPAGVKVLDQDGAYLVVAADKGTAAFSDIANELAAERGFWLDDAFASGGKHGYDHKALGITARGAWESALRHLRESGRDPEHGAPIRMVGIGDMSGDVFGNGLLRSTNVKLIAAFDHRHIFIDPDPDPPRSFAERKRLFEMPGSQWSDYNPLLISAGGGVFGRGQKQITLSPQARAALRCEAAEFDGESLVRAILRAEVDLLYNGGIGTYVRARGETDAQVADHANDSCRVTAASLRTKIVVEGGNLGFTQRARIEYALAGGRINTDAIDNSAGVDMSDHEVNLKILLQPAVARRAITSARRNRVLEEASAEVVALVLEDNREQALLLSLEQIRSRADVVAFRELVSALEQRGWLRREDEALPGREELRDRRTRFAGLTRPELSVITAYTKIDLSREIETAPLMDDPYLIERYLKPYFPASIATQFGTEITAHPLRRELVATQIANRLVNLMGSTMVLGLVRDYGADTEQAVRAWTIAAELLDLGRHYHALRDATAEITVEAEIAALFALARAAEHATRWALARPAGPIAETVEKFKAPLTRLAESFDTLLAPRGHERFERVYRDLRAAGHQEPTALDLARLAFARHLLDILGIAFELGIEPQTAAAAYFKLAGPIDFDLLETAIEGFNSDDRWERRAAKELGLELAGVRVQMTKAALADRPDSPTGASVHSPLRAKYLAEAQRLLAEMRALPSVSLPAIQVAVRALNRLAHSA